MSNPETAIAAGDQSWASVLDDFFAARSLSRRGVSAATRRSYTFDLVGWARPITRDRFDKNLFPDGGRHPGPPARLVLDAALISDLTWQTLGGIYPKMRETLSQATCQRRVGTLRLFTSWLVAEGLLATDPMSRIDPPHRDVRLPSGWTTEELAALGRAVIAKPDGQPDRRRWPARDLALFALLCTTGLRAAELCGLAEGSLTRTGGETTATVKGKGGKVRAVPVPPEAMRLVDRYLDELDRALGPDRRHRCLFWLTSGRPLRPTSLDYLVEKWLRASGVRRPDGEKAHAFRHTFAKGLIRSGATAPAIQALLGHSDLKTTGIYVKATAADTTDAAMRSPSRDVLRTLSPIRAD